MSPEHMKGPKIGVEFLTPGQYSFTRTTAEVFNNLSEVNLALVTRTTREKGVFFKGIVQRYTPPHLGDTAVIDEKQDLLISITHEQGRSRTVVKVSSNFGFLSPDQKILAANAILGAACTTFSRDPLVLEVDPGADPNQDIELLLSKINNRNKPDFNHPYQAVHASITSTSPEIIIRGHFSPEQ